MNDKFSKNYGDDYWETTKESRKSRRIAKQKEDKNPWKGYRSEYE